MSEAIEYNRLGYRIWHDVTDAVDGGLDYVRYLRDAGDDEWALETLIELVDDITRAYERVVGLPEEA
jgi:hypothetical protein